MAIPSVFMSLEFLDESFRVISGLRAGQIQSDLPGWSERCRMPLLTPLARCSFRIRFNSAIVCGSE